jgi:polygalacturonase
MSTATNIRREFLKRAGAGLPGAALLFQAGQGGARAAEAGPAQGLFNVKAFGAAGNGASVDTPAINRTIQAAAAAGGGTVFFPAGNYLCYSIRLMSDVALYLDMGATIVAADSPAEGASGSGAYDLAEPNEWSQYQDYGHSHFRNSLLWGEGLKNVTISGPGRIWGKGLSRGAGGAPRAEQAGVGNKSISLKNCHNVLLRDFSILHGGHFCLLATGVDNLTIDNIMLDTNRDGFDIDCCRNVRVSNCIVNSPQDDAIVLKSSYGLGIAKPTEFVTITNCYVAGCFTEGTLLDGTYKRSGRGGTGRIKFGTESNAGFRNITISNCVFEGCQGLALETVDGALLEDVTITNISMRDIISAPIFLRLGRRMRGPKEIPIGTLKRVIIDNIVCSNCSPREGSIISGIPGHNIEDVRISNVQIQHQGGMAKEAGAIQPPENETAYPEPSMFGAMPSHGFYIRHVKGIDLSNIEIIPAKEDLRPAFVLDDVAGAEFFRIKTPKVADTPVFALHNVSDFSVNMCKGVADAHLDRVDGKTL